MIFIQNETNTFQNWDKELKGQEKRTRFSIFTWPHVIRHKQ